jgi:hypothetical protein
LHSALNRMSSPSKLTFKWGGELIFILELLWIRLSGLFWSRIYSVSDFFIDSDYHLFQKWLCSMEVHCLDTEPVVI